MLRRQKPIDCILLVVRLLAFSFSASSIGTAAEIKTKSNETTGRQRVLPLGFSRTGEVAYLERISNEITFVVQKLKENSSKQVTIIGKSEGNAGVDFEAYLTTNRSQVNALLATNAFPEGPRLFLLPCPVTPTVDNPACISSDVFQPNLPQVTYVGLKSHDGSLTLLAKLTYPGDKFPGFTVKTLGVLAIPFDKRPLILVEVNHSGVQDLFFVGGNQNIEAKVIRPAIPAGKPSPILPVGVSDAGKLAYLLPDSQEDCQTLFVIDTNDPLQVNDPSYHAEKTSACPNFNLPSDVFAATLARHAITKFDVLLKNFPLTVSGKTYAFLAKTQPEEKKAKSTKTDRNFELALETGRHLHIIESMTAVSVKPIGYIWISPSNSALVLTNILIGYLEGDAVHTLHFNRVRFDQSGLPIVMPVQP